MSLISDILYSIGGAIFGSVATSTHKTNQNYLREFAQQRVEHWSEILEKVRPGFNTVQFKMQADRLIEKRFIVSKYLVKVDIIRTLQDLDHLLKLIPRLIGLQWWRDRQNKKQWAAYTAAYSADKFAQLFSRGRPTIPAEELDHEPPHMDGLKSLPDYYVLEFKDKDVSAYCYYGDLKFLKLRGKLSFSLYAALDLLIGQAYSKLKHTEYGIELESHEDVVGLVYNIFNVAQAARSTINEFGNLGKTVKTMRLFINWNEICIGFDYNGGHQQEESDAMSFLEFIVCCRPHGYAEQPEIFYNISIFNSHFCGGMLWWQYTLEKWLEDNLSYRRSGDTKDPLAHFNHDGINYEMVQDYLRSNGKIPWSNI